MGTASQLYQLQEVDVELESDEQAVNRITSQLGNNEVITSIRDRLSSTQKNLEELKRQQRSMEWEIDDLTSKLKTIDEKLYSGRIRNPKELTDLQRESDELKARRAKLEDKDLAIMEQVEQANTTVNGLENELKALESEWHIQQQQLSAEMARLKDAIANLKAKRQQLAAQIDPGTVEIYREIRRQRGTAVARVEQGLCRGCRISLPVTELQKARTGSLVRCGSCGRILYLA